MKRNNLEKIEMSEFCILFGSGETGEKESRIFSLLLWLGGKVERKKLNWFNVFFTLNKMRKIK